MTTCAVFMFEITHWKEVSFCILFAKHHICPRSNSVSNRFFSSGNFFNWTPANVGRGLHDVVHLVNSLHILNNVSAHMFINVHANSETKHESPVSRLFFFPPSKFYMNKIWRGSLCNSFYRIQEKLKTTNVGHPMSLSVKSKSEDGEDGRVSLKTCRVLWPQPCGISWICSNAW